MKRLASLLVLSALFCNPAHAGYTPLAAITSGSSLSASVDLTPYIPLGAPTAVGIIMPSAWTSASITMQGSTDGCTTFSNVFVQGGTEYTITSPAASEYIILPPLDLVGINCLKLRSGTAGSPVNQAAPRSIQVVVARH